LHHFKSTQVTPKWHHRNPKYLPCIPHALPIHSHCMPIPSLHTECPSHPFTAHAMPTRRDDEQLADVQTTPNAGGLHSNSKHEPIPSLIPFPSIPSNCMPTQNPTRRMPFPSVPSTCPSHLFTPHADPIPSHRNPYPSLQSGCSASHALSIPSHRMPEPIPSHQMP